jgi:hypothetical protein
MSSAKVEPKSSKDKQRKNRGHSRKKEETKDAKMDRKDGRRVRKKVSEFSIASFARLHLCYSFLLFVSFPPLCVLCAADRGRLGESSQHIDRRLVASRRLSGGHRAAAAATAACGSARSDSADGLNLHERITRARRSRAGREWRDEGTREGGESLR